MSNEVYANMMEVSCKSASGKTICAFPDVCMTPPQTPATPPGVPIPYPNTGMGSDTTDGSTSVKISGKEIMLKNKSCFSKSTGDEAGAAPKKGLVTSKNTGKVYFNMWSMDVKCEGENVVRHLDITTNNHASVPGNSPPMPHTDAMDPATPGSGSCPLGSSSCSVGSPVNPVLGTKVLAGDEDVDFTLAGPLPLQWQRYYLSSNDDVGWFGRGWNSPLEERLEGIPDSSGNLVERIEYVDPFGRRIAFDPLAPGGSNVSANEKITLSRMATGQYQLAGVDGLTRRFAERSHGVYRLAALLDRNGNAIYLDYSRAAAGIVLVDCSGKQRLELTFEDGRLMVINELRGTGGATQRVLLMRYTFNRQGGDLRQAFNRADECLRSFEYTPGRLMRKHVIAGAFIAEYEYVGSGAQARVVRHWDNVGRSWTFAYATDHTAVVDQDGRTTLYHFDAAKRLIGVTDPLGQISRVGLDKQGNVRALVDPSEHVEEAKFDERGNPVEIVAPDGGVTTLQWHPELPVPVSMTDPLQRTTTYAYDERGNLVAQVDAAGAETRYEHDEHGQVVTMVNAMGGITRRAYNEQGKLTRHTDCSGNVTIYSYDANGLLAATTNALGEQTKFDYDAAGNLVRQTLADGAQEHYENDLMGRLTALVDGNGARSEYHYTSDGLMAYRTDALGHSVHYSYDRARRLIELVNENKASYRFSYDALDRLIEEIRFDGTRTRFSYNSASHLVETVEEPGTADPIVFRYARDAVGRLLVRAGARGARATFEYDAAGQRIGARTDSPPIDVRMAYDKAGRRIEERVDAGSFRYAIAHSFDALGNQLTTTLPDGSEIGALYYGCGNVHQISLDQKPVCDFERDALYREVACSQGALTTTSLYGAGGQLLRMHAGPVPGGHSTVQIDRRFEYDAGGRLVLTLEGARRLSYGYDAMDRLTRFNEERFAYDSAHNRLSTESAPSVVADNRVTELEAFRYRYDVHGRVVEKRSGPDKLVQLTWNEDHRLASSTTSDARGSRTVDYVYDAFGRRIAKRDGLETIWFVWDRDRLLQERREIVETTFLYEPGTHVPLAQVVVRHAGNGASENQLYYYHCDQVGLPRELTDEQGQLAWAAEYKGWGRVNVAHPIEAKAPPQVLRYQGGYSDEETGLQYILMRYYDPDASRFASKDPVGLAAGLNEYAYGPNPVFWIDPLGLTGTYIFQNAAGEFYVGKGPKVRCQASQRGRLGKSCNATATVHQDFGDDDMGFMVEHRLMVKYNAQASPNSFNSAKLQSPGAKKYAKADAATKAKVDAHADAMEKSYEAKKAACATPATTPPNNGECAP
jgi:RHS repeat-associated protein